MVDNLRGIILMLISTALITLMVVGIRFLSESLHAFEVAFFRNLFGLLVLIPILARSGTRPLYTRRFGLLALRGVFNACAMLMFFLAVTLIPIAKVAAYGFTTPLWVTILAVFLLGERIGLIRALGLAVGFFGAMVVLRPGIDAVDTGSLYALGSAAIWAGAVIVTKHVSRTEASVTITFYGAIILVPLTFIPAVFFWTWPTPTDWLLLAGLGLVWMLAQLSMTQALKLSDATLIMPFDFTKLIWGALAGFLIFAEVPSIWTWIGGTLVLAATSYVAFRENRGTSN